MVTTNDYAATMEALSDHEIRSAAPMPEALLIERDGPCAAYFAPFDYVNPNARVVIVGITPGQSQALTAVDAFRSARRSGKSISEATKAAKNTASFGGPLRRNLVRMLDYFGLHGWLGVQSTAELFTHRRDLAHFASALQYPVFVNGKNYAGRSPDILRNPFLRRQLETYLPRQLQQLPEAVFVPLGETVTRALEHLGQRGVIRQTQIFPGLVHPSGANAERIAYLIGTKSRDALSAKTNAAKLDTGREHARAFMAGLRGASKSTSVTGN
ncbi:hypothetical protein H0Z60_14540 [Ectothiorhodospiraceae bacterium WFHF3C12]|nr:hypothetical protein [Ectothiorhodospiraceae bacterium WFHF3C12]